MEESLIYRLKKRAEIRRNILTRKSVIEGKPDRIADLLEEAATEIESYRHEILRVMVEIQTEILHHPSHPNVGKRGCVERLQNILESKDE